MCMEIIDCTWFMERIQRRKIAFFSLEKKIIKNLHRHKWTKKKRNTTVQSRQWSDESTVVAGSAEISELP